MKYKVVCRSTEHLSGPGIQYKLLQNVENKKINDSRNETMKDCSSRRVFKVYIKFYKKYVKKVQRNPYAESYQINCWPLEGLMSDKERESLKKLLESDGVKCDFDIDDLMFNFKVIPSELNIRDVQLNKLVKETTEKIIKNEISKDANKGINSFEKFSKSRIRK